MKLESLKTLIMDISLACRKEKKKLIGKKDGRTEWQWGQVELEM